MKVTFDMPTLMGGTLQLVWNTKKRIKEAEKDGKVETKELANIVLGGIADMVYFLAMAMRVDGQPVVRVVEGGLNGGKEDI